MIRPIVFVILLSSFLLEGCAFDLAHVSFTPTQFAPYVEGDKSFALKEPIYITEAPCGYDRTLRQDTRWDLIGRIPEGDIYKSRDQVLTVECSNVHEAYIVVLDSSIVGFYLPVEKGFVKISNKIKLSIK